MEIFSEFIEKGIDLGHILSKFRIREKLSPECQF